MFVTSTIENLFLTSKLLKTRLSILIDSINFVMLFSLFYHRYTVDC